MRYDTSQAHAPADDVSSVRSTGGMRCTLCVSSQVGCDMGCTFCATGTMGFQGNLSCGEIVEQLVIARRFADIRNVVFMGMGEPLNNYKNVKAAVQLMTEPSLFALSKRHVTVSTVGVIPRILTMAEDLPGVSLALSLHAPTQEVRLGLVPSAKAYPLPKLIAAVHTFQHVSKQRVFVEYVMLQGINCAPQHARQLGELLAHTPHPVVVNLIPWNPVLAPRSMTYAAPPAAVVRDFQAILRGEFGLACTVRQEKGQDIAGACG